MTSNALFKKLSTVFILPSIRRLQQLSVGYGVHADKIDISYLSNRVSSLSDKERFVVLMLDEVYTAAKVEYQHGEFVGLAENGEVAKTLLVFMVQSLTSKFRDVVKLVPVSKLTSESLHIFTRSVMDKLHDIGLRVVALSADNHVVNQLVISLT